MKTVEQMREKIQSILSRARKGAIYHKGEWLIGQDCYLEIPERRELAKQIVRELQQPGRRLPVEVPQVEAVKKLLRTAPLWEYDVERLTKLICQLFSSAEDLPNKENSCKELKEVNNGC